MIFVQVSVPVAKLSTSAILDESDLHIDEDDENYINYADLHINYEPGSCLTNGDSNLANGGPENGLDITGNNGTSVPHPYATVKLRTTKRRHMLKLDTHSLIETNTSDCQGRQLVFSMNNGSKLGVELDKSATQSENTLRTKSENTLRKRVSFSQFDTSDKLKSLDHSKSLDHDKTKSLDLDNSKSSDHDKSSENDSSSQFSTPFSTPGASRTPSFKETPNHNYAKADPLCDQISTPISTMSISKTPSLEDETRNIIRSSGSRLKPCEELINEAIQKCNLGSVRREMYPDIIPVQESLRENKPSLDIIKPNSNHCPLDFPNVKESLKTNYSLSESGQLNSLCSDSPSIATPSIIESPSIVESPIYSNEKYYCLESPNMRTPGFESRLESRSTKTPDMETSVLGNLDTPRTPTSSSHIKLRRRPGRRMDKRAVKRRCSINGHLYLRSTASFHLGKIMEFFSYLVI